VIIGSVVLTSAAQAHELHPQLEQKPAKLVLNKDILVLSADERSAWVHGAMAQMVQVYARVDPQISACLTAWAFGDGNGLTAVTGFQEAYPNELATVTLLAVAAQACPDI
jgi:hypothetical protein